MQTEWCLGMQKPLLNVFLPNTDVYTLTKYGLSLWTVDICKKIVDKHSTYNKHKLNMYIHAITQLSY